MKKIRAILVDDEQPARERLRRILQPFEDVEIVGEAEDGERAIEEILEQAPDLVFLDIQMPGCDGIGVAASLPAPRPHIIFCTAYDEYAVDAFELHAVDYLLKPVNRSRLARALERVRGAAPGKLDASIDEAGRTAKSYPSRFLAKHGTTFHVVPRQDVLYFASDGGLTMLQTAERHYWMQPTLGELEGRLDPAGFFRISRAAIVQLENLRAVRPLAGGQGEAELSDGTRLEVSRRRFKALVERLGET